MSLRKAIKTRGRVSQRRCGSKGEVPGAPESSQEMAHRSRLEGSPQRFALLWKTDSRSNAHDSTKTFTQKSGHYRLFPLKRYSFDSRIPVDNRHLSSSPAAANNHGARNSPSPFLRFHFPFRLSPPPFPPIIPAMKQSPAHRHPRRPRPRRLCP